MTLDISELSTAQLKQVIVIREQIDELQQQLAQITGAKPVVKTEAEPGLVKRKTMSAEAKAKISAYQRAKWAKIKGTQAKAPAKGKGKMSAEGRANIAAGAKARWAKIKGAQAEAPQAKAVVKGKRKMSAAAKAKLAAIAKKRWAKIKAAGKRAL